MKGKFRKLNYIQIIITNMKSFWGLLKTHEKGFQIICLNDEQGKYMGLGKKLRKGGRGKIRQKGEEPNPPKKSLMVG